jgi:hypothetical protein
MKIIVKFENNNFIIIRLLNIPVIKKWFNFAKNIKDYTVERIDAPFSNSKFNFDEKYDKLKNTVDIIKKKYHHKSELLNIPESFNKSQKFLNELHRFFTYHASILFGFIIETNKYDPSFETPSNKDDWFKLIDSINTLVHELESYTLLEITSSFCIDSNLVINSLNISRDKNNLKFPWEINSLIFTEEEIFHNYEFDLNKEDEYPVVLSKDILGKCVLQSFHEKDDPSQFDCTGRLLSWGSFDIDLNLNRRKVYKSIMFEKWAKKYKKISTDMPLEFQIGFVEEFSQDPTFFLENNLKLSTIEFLS